MSHLNTIYCNDTIQIFSNFFHICYHTAMLGNLVQTQSFLAKEKPAFHVNTLLIFIGCYRMLIGRVPTANYF